MVTKPYGKPDLIRTHRRRTGERLGLVHIRIWVTADDLAMIEQMKAQTERMIDEGIAERYGKKSPEE